MSESLECVFEFEVVLVSEIHSTEFVLAYCVPALLSGRSCFSSGMKSVPVADKSIASLAVLAAPTGDSENRHPPK